MNLTGQMMRLYVPEPIRRRALHELFGATAQAFGRSVPPLEHASADELLYRYARFTAEEGAQRLARGGDLAEVGEQLFSAADAIGRRLRRDLGITSTSDTMAVARAVYRLLRIDFRGTPDGDVRVSRCYFSDFYSAAVCKLISALDQGLLAGLSGGGRLEFRRRITEGTPSCVAVFTEAKA